MTEIVLQPMRGVGPIRFGMTRQEVVRTLGPPDHVVANHSLVYRALGNVGFDADDRCVFVGSAPDEVTVVVDGVRLQGRLCDVADELVAKGHTVTHGTDGPDLDFSYCDTLGLTLVRAELFDDSSRLCAVQTWIPSYWDCYPPVRSD